MLVRKEWSVRRRIAVVLFWTAAITLFGIAIPVFGARRGWWGWPEPSSQYGVVLGLLGGLIILFEMALYPRKMLRKWRGFPRFLWSQRLWLRAHVALGFLVFPIIVIHAGYGFGGPLSRATMILFLLTIASGIWGLIFQQWLPQKLLDEVTDETIAVRTDTAARYYLGRPSANGEEGAREHDQTGLAYRLVEALVRPPAERDELVIPVVVITGAAGNATAVTHQAAAVVTGRPAIELEAFRDDVLIPYLERGRHGKSPLATQAEADRRFARLREAVPAEAHPVILRLQLLADLRRRWDYEAKLNVWLHYWIPFHVLVSAAMTGLMLVHAFRALKYW